MSEQSRPQRALLDGSMGQELLHRGVVDDPLLWTAHALADNAAAVGELHAEYIAAGADIITTHTYATNRQRFAADSAGRAHFSDLNRLAGEVARRAADASSRPVLVAASLPPTRESYRPERVPPFEQMLEEYGPQVELLAEYADLFLCETMSTADEGRAAATAAAAVALPIWVSWTLRDNGSDRLRSGESIADAVAALDGLPVTGLLLNCCAPESISQGLPQLCSHSVEFVGAYANGFSVKPEQRITGASSATLGHREDLSPAGYAAHAEHWLSQGANVIGGCCEIGPRHIARLRTLLDS